MSSLDSLFVEFYNEKCQGDILIYNFNNKAFISYSIENGNMHLWELYVRKQYRSTFLIGVIVKKALNIAMDSNCSSVYGYVESSHKSPEKVVRLLKSMDFKLDKVDNNRVVFIKVLNNGTI